jgi:hypothetical protein
MAATSHDLSSIKTDATDAKSTFRSLISVYSTAEVDALISAIDGLTDEDIDTLAELNSILTDANVASVTYVDGLASNYATAAQGATADTALQPSDITSGTITPGTGDIDFDDLGGGLTNIVDVLGGVEITGHITGTHAATTDDTVSNVTRFGQSAAASNTGEGLAAFGLLAGHSNEGSNVAAFGTGAARLNTGDSLLAFGTSAGRSNSGDDCVLIGENAGHSNTQDDVVAVGATAGQDNSGERLSAVGFGAGRNNTGTRSTAIGYNAGFGNTGANCIFVGFAAGTSNTTSSRFEVSHSSVNATPLIVGDLATNTLAIGATAIGEATGELQAGAGDFSDLVSLSSTTSTSSATVGSLTQSWVDSTHATRKGQIEEKVYDTAARTVARSFANGTNGYKALKVVATAPADANLANGEVVFHTDGSGNLAIKLKDSGGTVRTGSVTLS